jgi:hypothetical protein
MQMSRVGRSTASYVLDMVNVPDGLTIAGHLFKIDRSVFERALLIEPGRPLPPEANERAERLRAAMLDLRQVIPEEFFSVWAHRLLPGIAESPLDILVGNDGFEKFVRLTERIIHGDFA